MSTRKRSTTSFAAQEKYRQEIEAFLSKLQKLHIPPENVYQVAGESYFEMPMPVETKSKTMILLRDLRTDLSKNHRDNLEMMLHKCGAEYKDLKLLYKNDLAYLAENLISF